MRPERGDLIAGVTVALVLIPQAIAYATLAGLPPVHGLYAAAIAPVFAGIIGSSPYLQTGPVALTSLLTLGALSPLLPTGTGEYAAYAALLALIVGAVRLLVGLFRLGGIAYLMSQPVVQAFTVAASLLILASQVPGLLGVRAASANPVLAAVDALSHPSAWNPRALAVGVAVGAVTVLARRLHPLIPGAFLAAAGALVAARVTDLGVPLVGRVPAGIPGLDLALPWSAAPTLLFAGVVIAVVGFAEPASIARQYATVDRVTWSPDREFMGQGLANVSAGLFGGYPVGGSFSRSSLNRLSGARTRWSGVVTGLSVLAVLPVVEVLSWMPTAALSGLIILAVRPLLRLGPLLEMRRIAPVQFSVAAGTFAATIATAPRVELGVVAGVVLAMGVHLWREMRLELEVWRHDGALHVRPQGVLYFGSAPSLEERIRDEIAAQPDLEAVVVHLDQLGRLDLTGAMVLRATVNRLCRSGTQVMVLDPLPQARGLVTRVLGQNVVGYTD